LGVVSALRRAVARAVVGVVTPAVAVSLCARGQLGVGAAAAAEFLSREAQAAVARGHVVARLDRANAYGAVHPAAVDAALATLPPGIRGMMLGPALVFGVGEPRRFAGLFQGCPLSPLGFAVTQEAACAGVDFGHVTYAAFLDDQFVLGEPARVQRACDELERAGETVGLRLRRTKSYWLGAGAPVGWPVVRVGLVLGVPVGLAAEVRAAAQEAGARAAAAVRRAARALPLQAALYIMRVSAGVPLVAHLARSLPDESARVVLGPVEEARDELLRSVLALPLDGVVPEAAAWPLRLGGLGCPRPTGVLRVAARVAGTIAALRLRGVIDGAPCLPVASGREGVSSGRLVRCLCGARAQGCERCAACCVVLGACPECAALADAGALGLGPWARDAVASLQEVGLPAEPAERLVALAAAERQAQRLLYRALCRGERERLLARAPRELCAALVAGTCSLAAAALRAPPLGESALIDDEVVVMARTRMGMGVLERAPACGCPMVGSADYHARACPYGPRVVGHNVVADALGSFFHEAGLPVRIEPRAAGKARCRFDVEVRAGVRVTAYDVCIADAGARRRAGQATRRGAVASGAVAYKLRKYAARVPLGGELFVLALESHGALGVHDVDGVDHVQTGVRRAVALVAEHLEVPAGEVRENLLQRLSAAYFRQLSHRYYWAGVTHGDTGAAVPRRTTVVDHARVRAGDANAPAGRPRRSSVVVGGREEAPRGRRATSVGAVPLTLTSDEEVAAC